MEDVFFLCFYMVNGGDLGWLQYIVLTFAFQ